MVETVSWGVVGVSGNVGGAIMDNLMRPDIADQVGHAHEPVLVANSKGVFADAERGDRLWTPKGKVGSSILDVELPDILYVATPTTDDGEPAADMIEFALHEGVTVVTAEKGIANADVFRRLGKASGNFRTFGIRATVGASTPILLGAREQFSDPRNVSLSAAVLNGTANYTFGEVAKGLSPEAAVLSAVDAGYAEPLMPGQKVDPVGTILGELGKDFPRKVAILTNITELVGDPKKLLDWRTMYDAQDLNPDHVDFALRHANAFRYLVYFYRAGFETEIPDALEATRVGGFAIEHAGWNIVAGFHDVTTPEAADFLKPIADLDGPRSAIVTALGPRLKDGTFSDGGPYVLSGDGAGANATADAMINNAYRRAVRPFEYHL
jgi:homoserine dehydrogenase